jgi:hypothetical protein
VPNINLLWKFSLQETYESFIQNTSQLLDL